MGWQFFLTASTPRVDAVMTGARTRARVVIVMNPRSGGGKTARYGLVQRAEGMGAQVWTTSEEEDAASLARNAVVEGAQVLGVAGGDGTVSAVAAVACRHGPVAGRGPSGHPQPLCPGPGPRSARSRAGAGRPGRR
ncbi:diacylglycerol kinase family protein [Streptomyces sp. NPDC058676]|uniref:diacylglycerol kinase family protein n=1 Tax=unclassified Streptomyces TaxID=2593676 RepID=UPI00364FC15D